jgi:hypothetical protein
VGTALRHGLERSGYEARSVGHDPALVRETASWGDVIVLAVPFTAIDETVREIGDAARGKVVIDVTNALTHDRQLALGFNTSGAEELQKKLPGAKVVKSFNTVFAKNMETGRVKDTPISLFTAGDDSEAKQRVLGLGRDIGFDPVDAGPLRNARWLETLGYLNIQLGFTQKMGTDIGFKLVH